MDATAFRSHESLRVARLVADRPRREAALAVGATVLLFSVGFVAEEAVFRRPGVGDLLLGAVLGAVLAIAGYAASSRVRPMTPQPWRLRLPRGVLAMAAGGAFSLLSLAVVFAVAGFDDTVLDIFRGGSVTVALPFGVPLARAFGAAVMEEVIARLLLMGGIAWLAVRRGASHGRAYGIALLGSALIFGLLHFPGFSVAAAVLVPLNTAAGLVLGWLFWRWGLPYAILCHFIAGLVIQGLGPHLAG